MTTEQPLEFAPIETGQQPEFTPTPAPENLEPEKKKRGRPKKTEAKTDETSFKKPEPNSGNIFDDIKKEVDENERLLQQKQASNGDGPEQSEIHKAAKNVVDGYMLLTLMDTFFPMIIKMFVKKSKLLKDKDIQLTKDQKIHLEPIADEVAQGLLSFLDPVTLFFVLAGSLYWQNTAEAISNLPKNKTE